MDHRYDITFYKYIEEDLFNYICEYTKNHGKKNIFFHFGISDKLFDLFYQHFDIGSDSESFDDMYKIFCNKISIKCFYDFILLLILYGKNIITFKTPTNI